MKNGLRFLFPFSEYVANNPRLAPDLQAARDHMEALQEVASAADDLLSALTMGLPQGVQAQAIEALRMKLESVR